MSTAADLRPLTGADAEQAARVFRASRVTAMPWLPVLHSTEEDLGFFQGQIAEGRGWGAWVGEQLLAIAFWRDGWLDHLYVVPERRGEGLGSALLSLALAENPGELLLWTFARNEPAIGFYRRRGFEIVRETDGTGNEEGLPDVLMAHRSP